MLIEFRVKNFYSIRDEAVLSMVANRSDELRESNVFDPDVVACRPCSGLPRFLVRTEQEKPA